MAAKLAMYVKVCWTVNPAVYTLSMPCILLGPNWAGMLSCISVVVCCVHSIDRIISWIVRNVCTIGRSKKCPLDGRDLRMWILDHFENVHGDLRPLRNPACVESAGPGQYIYIYIYIFVLLFVSKSLKGL